MKNSVTNKTKVMLENKVKELKEKIRYENEAMEEYQNSINDLEDEISDYENNYDYESDPDGNDYDLNFVHEKREEIESLERSIWRCGSEIDELESQLNEIEFRLINPSLQTLLQKWERKLNEWYNRKKQINDDYNDDSYENEEDYQSDISGINSMIAVTSSIVEDIKSLIENEGDSVPKFDSIEDAYDYYWDLSRNPYDMYETERSLIDGEREFVEKCGYDWEQWCEINKNK